MRIVEISPYLYPHVGGVENHVEELSRHLASKGHEVTVVTSKHDKGLKNREERHGYEILRADTKAILFNTPISPAIKRILSGLESDIFHVHYPPPLTEYFSTRVLRHKKGGRVMTYHCDVELPVPLGGLVTMLYSKVVTTYVSHYMHRIIMTSSSYQATSRSMWSKSTKVIPNAVDIERFNPATDGRDIRERFGLGDRVVVMYLGRLRYHKGLEYLIESARYTDENVAYMIVGEGNYEPTLRELVSAYGVEDRVVFTGRAPYDRLPEYYAASDIFTLPSVSRLEAFGIVGLEAMAMEKPVIVSDIPGVRSVVEHGVCGFHTEPLNAKDIAEKINTLARDPSLRKRMGRRGRRRVERNYSWKTVSQAMELIYEEVLNGT